jgi:hypothetical protein
MAERRAQIVILCEGQQDATFVRRTLLNLGWDRRKIRERICPAGKQAGEQFVRTSYPAEVVALRSKIYLDLGLIAMTDADTRAVAERLRQLGEALVAAGLGPRQDDEPIALWVPRRNVETWIRFLSGREVDETTAYPKLAQERDCEPATRRLVELYRQHEHISEDTPPSLRLGLVELGHIVH